MDRSRLSLGGRALLLPAVLLGLATVGDARPPMAAPAPAVAVAAHATARPRVQQRQTTAQPAARPERRVRRGLTPAAVLGAGVAVALVLATPPRLAGAAQRLGDRPLPPRPRAPPQPPS